LRIKTKKKGKENERRKRPRPHNVTTRNLGLHLFSKPADEERQEEHEKEGEECSQYASRLSQNLKERIYPSLSEMEEEKKKGNSGRLEKKTPIFHSS